MDGFLRVDWAIGRLADRQHGVVALRQLIGLGLGRGAIEHRMRCGRLRRIHRGVYAVGHEQLTQEGIWMAAVLASGDDAALSHWSAAAHVRLKRSGGPLSHVTLPRQRRSRDRIRFHAARLEPDEVITHDAIATTCPGRTLIDLAPLLHKPALARLVEAAEQIPWAGPSLPELIGRHAGRSGIKALRAVWEEPKQRTRSEFEAEVLQAVRAAGLPLPEFNQVIEGFEVDAVWRSDRVIAEIDTYATHGSRFAFERDRDRDRILQLAEWQVVRITPANLAAVIADLRQRLGRPRAANATGTASRSRAPG